MTEQLPKWLELLITGLLSGATVGAIISAVLIYKERMRGHAVAEDHNKRVHEETALSLLLTSLQTQVTTLSNNLSETQKNNIELQKTCSTLFAHNQLCEERLDALTKEVKGMKEEQAKEVVRQAERERVSAERVREAEAKVRDLEENKRELAIIAEGKLRDASEQDILDRIDRNTKIIDELSHTSGISNASAIEINTSSVRLNTTACEANTEAIEARKEGDAP